MDWPVQSLWVSPADVGPASATGAGFTISAVTRSPPSSVLMIGAVVARSGVPVSARKGEDLVVGRRLGPELPVESVDVTEDPLFVGPSPIGVQADVARGVVERHTRVEAHPRLHA